MGMGHYPLCFTKFKNYQQDIWRHIPHFQYFNIIYDLRIRNFAAYTLANETIMMYPLRNGFSIGSTYKCSILENITQFCVFNDIRHILHFMANIDVFKDEFIEERCTISTQEYGDRIARSLGRWVGVPLCLKRVFPFGACECTSYECIILISAKH